MYISGSLLENLLTQAFRRSCSAYLQPVVRYRTPVLKYVLNNCPVPLSRRRSKDANSTRVANEALVLPCRLSNIHLRTVGSSSRTRLSGTKKAKATFYYLLAPPIRTKTRLQAHFYCSCSAKIWMIEGPRISEPDVPFREQPLELVLSQLQPPNVCTGDFSC